MRSRQRSDWQFHSPELRRHFLWFGYVTLAEAVQKDAR